MNNGGGGGLPFSFDRKADFEKMAGGKPYFLLSQVTGNNSLAEFAKEKGITNGQITFPLFNEYRDQQRAKLYPQGGPGRGPGGNPPGTSGSPGVIVAPPPSVTVLSPQQQQNPNVLNDLADAEFRRRDQNDDNMLNSEELPGSLRDNLAKWDINTDGLINMLEYRPYYIAKLKGEGEFDRNNKSKKSDKSIIIIDEENWETRPKVLRAGNLHPDLPSWFRELDIDVDGQVALHEWRLKKPIDEFRTWDANNDGLITQEEALKLKSVLAGSANKKTGPGSSVASTGPGERPSMNSTPGGNNPGGFRGLRDFFRKPGDGDPRTKDRP